jgi:hypothetical protein
MNFSGPGTKLEYIGLIPITHLYKEWSKPVDRVDEAAYHHDLAYAAHSDTASRNVADRIILQELDLIDNPTMREKDERAIVKPIINAKQRFGLGLNDRNKQGALNFIRGASNLPMT